MITVLGTFMSAALSMSHTACFGGSSSMLCWGTASPSGALPVGAAPKFCISLPKWWAPTAEASVLLYGRGALGLALASLFFLFLPFLPFYPDTYLFQVAYLRLTPTNTK